jgi:hypothetical protein
MIKIPGIFKLLKFFRKFIKLLDVERTNIESFNQQLQKVLVNQYIESVNNKTLLYEQISSAGFRCYSQFEEDGIILYVLSCIGMKTRKVVEMCIGDGKECMATNLVLNHGFMGFLFDGDSQSIEIANKFFRSKKDCLLLPPYLRAAWITKENVNELLMEAGAVGEVDLLSLDIDGNDYYVWEAISIINPRLCVFETHNVIPSDLSLTIPYKADFNSWDKNGHEQDFRSVSLLAMKKISEKKGYRLIGGHKHGFNVFFLRNDIGQDLFPEVSIDSVHDNLYTKISMKERWPYVKDMPWVEV